MTKRQCWRYRCDFCKKSGCSAGHMRNHETHCTMNPNRVCRLHRVDDEFFDEPQPPIENLLAALNASLPDCGMARLREVASNCPVCILAGIRQSGIDKWDGDPDNQPPSLGFSFKSELSTALKELNELRGGRGDY